MACLLPDELSSHLAELDSVFEARCAWCEREAGITPQPGVSHTVCERHAQEVFNEGQKFLDQSRAAVEPAPVSDWCADRLRRLRGI